MSIEVFSDFLTQTVTIEPLAGQDAYDLRSYGAAVSYACRIQPAMKQYVDLQGVQRMTNVIIYIPGHPSIGPKDRLTLPSGFTPQQPPILSVAPVFDEAGAHHTKVVC